MDLAKLKILMGRNKVETPEQAAFKEAALKMGHEASLIRGLKDHPGWELLDEFLKTKQKVMNQELKVVDPTNIKAVVRLQEKSKIIDEFYNFLNAKILRDPEF